MTSVSPIGIEEAIKNSQYVNKSKADVFRVTNILDKVEKGETPVYETLELVADKVGDKKRNAIISVASLLAAATLYKSFGQKAMPLAKKAVIGVLNLIPEKGPKLVNKISKFINKELNAVSKPKFVKSLSGILNKVNVNKVGDVLEWGGALTAAALLGKGANKAADAVDDEIDLKKIQSQED